MAMANQKIMKLDGSGLDKQLRQELAGIPDSKLFNGSEQPDSPILDLHVGGVLVRDLPLEAQAKIVRRQTDEGIAEANEGKTGSGIQVDAPRRDRRWVGESSEGPAHWEEVMRSTDAFGKALDQRRDDILEREMEVYQARDPLKEVADQFTAPGMKPKFLSASKIKDGGGTGDYRVVKYPDGHPMAGDPVKVKGMILGEMPEARAIARNKHYRNKGNQLLAQIESEHKGQAGLSDQ